MPNPIDIIKRDHKTVEGLFRKYEELSEDALETKQKLIERITKELRIHTEMEERIFYAKAKEVFGKEDDKIVEEAIAEHDVAKRLLEVLSVTHPEDPQFDARVMVLNENVAHHVKEEEEELLPRAEQSMDKDTLDQLGEDMEAFKLRQLGE